MNQVLPGAGLGITGAIYPTDTTYMVAGVHDANGRRTTSGFNSFFDEGDLSVGLGIEDFLGQNDDVVGVAASWQSPTSRGPRDQYVIETFYRLYLRPQTHLSPDVQVVIDPANAPSKDAVTVFGLRLRTLY